jgi:hypothetical protein
VLGELSRQPVTRRIGLAPLSAGAVADLAAASGLDATELYRLTGGNPFYVSETVAAGLHEIPAAARDATLARATGLSDPARQMLEAAALRCPPGGQPHLRPIPGDHAGRSRCGAPQRGTASTIPGGQPAR